MSLTLKHKHFSPNISIFHIYELSITPLCFRAQCASTPHTPTPFTKPPTPSFTQGGRYLLSLGARLSRNLQAHMKEERISC